jgi:hypothetical protein
VLLLWRLLLVLLLLRGRRVGAALRLLRVRLSLPPALRLLRIGLLLRLLTPLRQRLLLLLPRRLPGLRRLLRLGLVGPVSTLLWWLVRAGWRGHDEVLPLDSRAHVRNTVEVRAGNVQRTGNTDTHAFMPAHRTATRSPRRATGAVPGRPPPPG